MNSPCYRFQYIQNDSGLLDDCIDASYIIHLEGNGRYKHIQNQLSSYQPSKDVYILYNRGFKKCHKFLPEQMSTYDLIDAFLHIFEHAKQKNFNHILVLEDDFIFHEKIKDSDVCKNIVEFVSGKKTDSFMYSLGCLPFVRLPSFNNHNRILLSGGTHACIYSKKMREHALNKNRDDIVDWDIYTNTQPHLFSRYGYYMPLCNQLHIDTENSDNWWNPLGLADFVKKIKKMFKMDTQLEPGHQFFYMFSLFIFWLLFLIVILCFVVFVFEPLSASISFPNKRKSR